MREEEPAAHALGHLDHRRRRAGQAVGRRGDRAVGPRHDALRRRRCARPAARALAPRAPARALSGSTRAPCTVRSSGARRSVSRRPRSGTAAWSDACDPAHPAPDASAIAAATVRAKLEGRTRGS